MKTKLLEASLYKKLPPEVRGAMLASGVIPVNDVLLPYFGNREKIFTLYGSYGSGKSVFFAEDLIDKCQNDPYFRCYFGRKVLDTVRGTVFQTLIDTIRDLKREKFFDFSDKPNGSMVIRCKENGNAFIPFGSNDSEGLKSIKDPTHFFCEELDQFSFEDFGFLFSRLRTEKAQTQFYGAFNTEKVYKSHWIRKVFFDGEYAGMARNVKVNYYDNHFIDREDYEKKLRLIANGNAAVFNSIAHGEWGIVKTGYEFWKHFSEVKHVVKQAYETGTTIHISLDENVNPYVTVAIWQVFTGTKIIRQVGELPCQAPDNNAPKAAKRLAEWLRQNDYKDVVYIYGDPSASRRSTVDENNRSFYDKFIEVLTRERFKVISRVGKSAPEVALSASFINEIYENNYEGWKIEIYERCFTSIEDYIVVKEDIDGKMFKDKVKDEKSGITYEPFGHFSDAKRYFITRILAFEFARYKARRKRGGSYAGKRA